MLTLCDSLVLSQKVLSAVKNIWPAGIMAQVDAYSNGREQGYSIYSLRSNFVRCSFSRDRYSDGIVIYTGLFHEFQLSGNTPTDASWKRRIYMGRPEDAALYIVAFFLSSIEFNIQC